MLLGAIALLATAPAAEWIGIGGGSRPDLNQVSLQADMALAREVFGDGGTLLFAGGPGAQGVQVLDGARRGDPLLHQLGAIFQPRGGRDTHYTAVTLPADGPATRDRVRRALREALTTTSTTPLYVVIGTHGEPAATPAETGVWLWGEDLLTATELSTLLDAAARPVRVVVGACYSGGFAELAFTAADPARGVTPLDRCGLFATTWQRVASGCDPDPDRGAHQGYPVHFLHGLRGTDRHGTSIDLDLDGDDRVSLLEAHTRARIASPSFDVPTTTSERWLREATRTLPPGEVTASLPEEAAVVEALTASLRLTAAEAPARLESLYQRWDAAEAEVMRADEAAGAAYRTLAGELLARWPVLDDPYHPDFAPTLARHRADVTRFLDTHAAAVALRAAEAEVSRLSAEVDRLMLRSAQVERLVRASENLELASRLQRAGGPALATWERLRRCENSVP